MDYVCSFAVMGFSVAYEVAILLENKFDRIHQIACEVSVSLQWGRAVCQGKIYFH